MKKNEKNKSPQTRSTPRQSRSMDLYDSILEAGLQCFEAIGFEKSTTNKIAAKAGVSIGSLYRYFPDKDLLLSALIRKFTADNRTYFVSSLVAQRGRPIDEAIETMISLSLSHFLKKKHFFCDSDDKNV